MLKTRFVRFFSPPQLGTLKKPCSRRRTTALGLSSEIAYNTMLSLFPPFSLYSAIGLFEESLQSTFKELAVQLSQVAPDEALVLIRDFREKLPMQKTRVYFPLALW